MAPSNGVTRPLEQDLMSMLKCNAKLKKASQRHQWDLAFDVIQAIRIQPAAAANCVGDKR